MENLLLSNLHPHPKNPRFTPREDVVDQIAAQIAATGKFDQAHALIVRPNADGYEIISGHHRALGARKAGLSDVPCWVRDMTDDVAYMALVLNNAQGELHPLEEGWHAIGSGKSIRDYAEVVGRKVATLQDRMEAAKVAKHCRDIPTVELRRYWQSLTAIHVAAEWLWPALVAHVVAEQLTVEVTRKIAGRFKKVDPPSEDLFNTAAIAGHLVDGTLKVEDLPRFSAIYEECRRSLVEDRERLFQELNEYFSTIKPHTISETMEICQKIGEEHRALVKLREEQDFFRTKREEQIAARTAQLRRNVSLEEWKTLAADEQASLLRLTLDDGEPGYFIKQDSDAIEWAQWSWNPVTGCLHDCPYCYARAMAESERFAKAYPNGFAPTLRPLTLLAPRKMKVPQQAAKDTRFRNVFTCSMADLFGRWVPAEWIEAVLAEIRNAPQWNFLCLTKFPKRMAEFDIPDNAWMGTTVDMQARVANAEAAFAKVKCRVRWLSVEPMLEPLKFKNLSNFDWVVIGGASSAGKTPEWHPPFPWIADLWNQATDAGCRVYFKTNLLGKRVLQLPFDAPIVGDSEVLPDQLKYLGAERH